MVEEVGVDDRSQDGASQGLARGGRRFDPQPRRLDHQWTTEGPRCIARAIAPSSRSVKRAVSKLRARPGPVAGLDDVIDPLVGVEARHRQEESLVACGMTLETPGLNGRVDNEGTPAVRLLDAAGNRVRAGDEQVNLLCRSIVQAAQR